MADAVSMLRQEIGKLEQELAKRRNALTILTGAGAATKRPTVATKKHQLSGKPAKRPSPQAPSLAERIVSHLTWLTDKTMLRCSRSFE